MYKNLLALAVGVAMAGCATAGEKTALTIETGFPSGALGLAAIERGDWKTAEAQLTAMQGVGENDPARLINLGQVYMNTNRPGLAIQTWQRALASPHHYQVTVANGTVASTRDVAMTALSRYQRYAGRY